MTGGCTHNLACHSHIWPLTLHSYKAGTEHAGFSPDQRGARGNLCNLEYHIFVHKMLHKTRKRIAKLIYMLSPLPHGNGDMEEQHIGEIDSN